MKIIMSVLDSIRSIRTGLVVAAAVVALTGGRADAQTSVRFSLSSRFDGTSAPFLIAFDKGYYRAEGLDVAIGPSAGAIEPITRVASGAYDMAVGDINALIKFRDRNPGAPKAVFIVYNRPPYAIIARTSRGIRQPKELEGKTLGAPAADSAFAQWKIFVHANGIDASKVRIENVGFPVREPMLAAGQVDAITGSAFSFVDLKDRGVPVNDLVVLLMADYGVDLYGDAIIVSPKFAAENPEAVKGFLRAFLRGLKDTVKEPSHAVDAVIKRNDEAKKDLELERLRMSLRENVLTSEVKANGYGSVDMERLDKSIDQIALTYEFRSRARADDVFDPTFLPPVTERRAN